MEISNQPRKEVSFKKPFQIIHGQKGNMSSPILADRATDRKWSIRFLDFLISLSLVLLSLGLPLFFLGKTFQGVMFEKQLFFYAVLLVGIIAWVVKGISLGELKIRRTPLDIPLGIFWLIYLLATIFSVDRWHSFWGFFGDPSRGLVSITAAILAYYLILSNFSEKRKKLMLWGIMLAGLLIVVWATISILGIRLLPASLSKFLPGNMLGSLTALAIFLSAWALLVLTIIFKVGEKQQLKNGIKIFLTLGLTAILLWDILLLYAIYAFVPWAGLFIGIGIFSIFILSLIVKPAMKGGWIIPMAVFLLILGFLITGKGNILKTNLPIEVSPSTGLSWEIAKGGLGDGVGHFLTGYGPAAYGYAFSKFKPQDFNLNTLYNIRFYQGSGLIFESLTTVGVLGAVALIVLILSFLSLGVYLLTKGKKAENSRILSLGLFTAVLVIIIDALLSKTEGGILLIGVILGAVTMATLLQEGETEERSFSLSLKSSPNYALALAFVFMVVSAGVVFIFVFLGKALVADMAVGKAEQEKNVELSAEQLVRAIKLNGLEGRYYVQLGQKNMVLANEELKKSNRDANKIQVYLNNSIEASKKGKDLMPKDVATVESLALIYENAGFYVADSFSIAEDFYRQALELEPNNPNFLLKLGQLKINLATTKKDENERKKLLEEAQKLFEEALAKKANLAPAYYNLALVKENLKDLSGAIEALTQGVNLDSRNVNYLFNLGRLYQARGTKEDLKIAEALYRRTLQIDDQEINAHFYLGLLYEKMETREKAKVEYQKVLGLVPTSNQETRAKIQQLIDNIDRGVRNIPSGDELPGTDASEAEMTQ